ncbi:uncharacterized protein SPSK_00982 [Sporothrix schenckii 1099-18]|uniref:BRCT domain-containing protein n=1 Tax=Sporothrix schenckii 1099-18 TaxID=1397361 RepID=A0A0F2LV84_SPOSC|nr:uncharacterized protein SPSK_00982 [Sporothrix schenckii 1099-18]KJR81373.1 hypothetical protein SPSK_00982 [Sporothrix schenckii 1099-18]
MEPQSPPKRMTRARAAAKATTADSMSSSAPTSTPASSRAKSATASSRARTSTATATTASAAAKRKLRTDDVETDNELDELGLDRPQPSTMQKAVRAARGRPKKTPVEAEPVSASAVVAPRPRGRPPTKKTPVPEAARPSSRASTSTSTSTVTTASTTEAPASRATRAKKTVTLAEDAPEEPAKKRATRARATSATASSAAANTLPSATTRISVRSASATVAAKSAAIKKKVTFEEPEKENIVPARGGGKAPAADTATESTTTATSTGLKAKPARRAANTSKAAATSTSTAGPRSRTASGRAGSAKPSAPLSPKKVTQVRLARDFDVDSEDELGASDESHLKPFERSPTKPSVAAGITPAERTKALANAGLDLESSTRDITANLASMTTLAPPDLQTGLLTSPACRPPPSPVKEGLMNSPARRLDGLVTMDGVLASTRKTTRHNSGSSSNNNKIDGHGGAKSHSVLFSPAKRFPVHPKNHAAGGQDDTLRSPMKLSLLQTPAKRPASPVKAAILLQRPDMKPSSLNVQVEEAEGGETEEVAEDEFNEADEADVSDAETEDNGHEADDDAENNDQTESLTQMLQDMAADAASALRDPESPSRRSVPGRVSAALARAADPTIEVDWAEVQSNPDDDVSPPGDPMEVDESILGAATALVAMSPPKPEPKAPSGVFGLRAKDLEDGNDDMDSDNDVTMHMPLPSNDDMPATPCPARTPSSRSARTSMGGQGTAKRPKMGKFGFTPLADQLNGWKVRSPAKAAATPTPTPGAEKQDPEVPEVPTEPVEGVPKASPDAKNASVMPSYFDDATVGHSLRASSRQSGIPVPLDDKECAGLMENVVLQEEIETPEFDEDLVVTEEDLDLAQEANEMSLMEPAELADVLHVPQSSDDAMSEASQEYGDENAIPIDPALLAESGASPVAVPPVTPQRVLTRTFHTVSKVPLKPADDSTPSQPSFRRRSMSASRLPTSSRRRSSISVASNAKSADNATGGSTHTSPSKRSDNGRGLTRSATVISYSPSKKDGRRESHRESRRRSRRESFGGPALTLEDALFDSSEDESPEDVKQPEVAAAIPSAPATPTKSSADVDEDADPTWSTAGTPARTPRRDLDPALLRGAVVFVDVHTTEGADASAIFVELLTQMGAQCVKTWPWNPASPASSTKDGSSRVGITHVVFKDGSKRTLDKVRESKGLVQCVGVSWVLDCERGNQWQHEAPYCVDTALSPRGPGRRRRSMEPEALANINGILVSTPPKQTGGPSAAVRECRTAPPPSTPMNRRDSTLWMRTPDDEDSVNKRRSHGARDGGQDDDQENGNDDVDGYGEPDWGMTALLTPVPKTPAPEAIARYAANIALSSPYGSDTGSNYGGGDDDDDDSTLASMQFDQGPLVTRTCPPKQRSVSYHELGAGILSREKDEGVLMRLMAARRKSLQFAPKVASPLSKAWN